MNTKVLPLCGPPSYEYEPTGPFFVCHQLSGDRAQAWVLWTLDSAVLRFWLYDNSVTRKVMVDAFGVTVIGTDIAAGYTQMVGCRTVMEATLNVIRRAPSYEIESELEIVRMIETLQLSDGQAL